MRSLHSLRNAEATLSPLFTRRHVFTYMLICLHMTEQARRARNVGRISSMEDSASRKPAGYTNAGGVFGGYIYDVECNLKIFLFSKRLNLIR